MTSCTLCSLNNSFPPIGNSLKKQKTLYKVLTPSVKSPYKFLWAVKIEFISCHAVPL